MVAEGADDLAAGAFEHEGIIAVVVGRGLVRDLTDGLPVLALVGGHGRNEDVFSALKGGQCAEEGAVAQPSDARIGAFDVVHGSSRTGEVGRRCDTALGRLHDARTHLASAAAAAAAFR